MRFDKEERKARELRRKELLRQNALAMWAKTLALVTRKAEERIYDLTIDLAEFQTESLAIDRQMQKEEVKRFQRGKKKRGVPTLLDEVQNERSKQLRKQLLRNRMATKSSKAKAAINREK